MNWNATACLRALGLALLMAALHPPLGLAQLPPLTASGANGGAATITWPYTHSGFVLEESAVLASPAWSVSTLTPTYDPARAAFFATTPATRAATYFRLRQPADLRGIYVYSSDVYSISSNYSRTLSTALGAPGVDGLVLVAGWNGLEPANHGFNWTNLDFWLNQAATRGIKLDLAILSGSSIPGWVFDPPSGGGAGATALNFSISPHGGQTSRCESDVIAAPWDRAYLSAWSDMLGQLSSHLRATGAYDGVTLLRLTGIDRTTDELRLPAETPRSTGLNCVRDAPAQWRAAGYTPDKLLFGWSNIVHAFRASFPDKSFSVAIIPNNAFPPIDNRTNLVVGGNRDANQPLLALAAAELPGRLVVQFNFLMTSNAASVAVPQAAMAYGTLAAYQSNNYNGSSGGGAACGGTPASPTPCDDAEYLNQLQEGVAPLGPAAGLRSQYIEVFPSNVLAFTNAIWRAHGALLASP